MVKCELRRASCRVGKLEERGGQRDRLHIRVTYSLGDSKSRPQRRDVRLRTPSQGRPGRSELRRGECGSIDPQVGGQHVPCKGRQATSLIRSSPCIWVHIP